MLKNKISFIRTTLVTVFSLFLLQSGAFAGGLEARNSRYCGGSGEDSSLCRPGPANYDFTNSPEARFRNTVMAKQMDQDQRDITMLLASVNLSITDFKMPSYKAFDIHATRYLESETHICILNFLELKGIGSSTHYRNDDILNFIPRQRVQLLGCEYKTR